MGSGFEGLVWFVGWIVKLLKIDFGLGSLINGGGSGWWVLIRD